MNSRAFVAMAVLTFATLALLGSFVTAVAADTGQPNQNCEAVFPSGPLTPQGFNTNGFATATSVYAGIGQNTLTPASSSAVSQYDVACFQVAQH